MGCQVIHDISQTQRILSITFQKSNMLPEITDSFLSFQKISR